MSAPKYTKGRRIDSWHELVMRYETNSPVFMRDKIQNWSWLQNMSLWTLKRFLNGGGFFIAIPVQEEEREHGSTP